ncbi:MAG TPA: TetR/AcrR family transcriptional regulator [Pseudonocardiaceae bacterium]|nr:TetR/AcrR family transcriptional regulator [Pseudonocardiaceae bacterium]
MTTVGSTDLGPHRRRLLDGLTASIEAVGYRDSTVADIVRHAHTSRRTFYEQFASKDACFVALLTDENAKMVHQISAAVDPAVPWERQVRQAVEAWIACAEASPAITVSWIRDLPSLGTAARQLQRELMEAFIVMLRTLWDTDEYRALGVGPVTRQLAITLLGGLRELIAATVEDGGRVSDITEVAVRASVALLRA